MGKRKDEGKDGEEKAGEAPEQVGWEWLGKGQGLGKG